MSAPKKIAAALLLLLLIGIGAFVVLSRPPLPAVPTASVHDYSDRVYGDKASDRVIDVGIIANSIASAFAGECLFHDRVLQRQLAAEGWTLRAHAFASGRDMLPFGDGRLEILTMGDSAALAAMHQQRVGVFALTRRGFNSLIAKRRLAPHELKGLRIAYVPGTVGQTTLELALRAADLSMAQIVPVAVAADADLASMLLRGEIDAASTWEPNTARVLSRVDGSSAVFRAESHSFLLADLDFAARHPRLLQAVLAAVLRATRWASQQEAHAMTALDWIRQTETRFAGASKITANSPWLDVLHRETVGNPSFPLLPQDIGAESGALYPQFALMKANGLLPAEATWPRLSARIDAALLPELVRAAERWRIDQFNYAPEHLYPQRRD